jgi:hypothetical protein
MTTWTIKFETMTGETKTAKYKAENLDKAIDLLCSEVRVGNILEACDCYRVQWL